MPKSQFIDPATAFEPTYIKFKDIPVCQYKKTPEEEIALYGRDNLLRIYRDMRIIRVFETMLNEIKTKSEYRSVKYTYPGPAHLSIGQEASCVGQAYALTIDDFSFGSHRSHGEILARGLAAIHQLDEAELYTIMSTYMDGSILRVVEDSQREFGDIKELAICFLLYGTLAEIFGRTTGFNRGLGGSMHAFFTPFGIYPNNAIVGGAGPMALGAALYKRCNKKRGIVVANIGDGALGRGPVLEAIGMSAMDQVKKLWDKEGVKGDGGLPILFNIFDNFYGMGGQTQGETMGFDMAARIGAGFSPDALLAERVNGYDPLAVADAVARQKKNLTSGRGPALLDVVTYRVSGHSPSDSSTYRTPEEIAAWRDACPIAVFREKFIAAGIFTSSELDAIDKEIMLRTERICSLAADEKKSPRMDLVRTPDAIASLMFSNEHVPSMDPEREPEVLILKEENPRAVQLATRKRYAYDESGKLYPKAKLFTLRDGIFEAVLDKIYEDATLIAYGEDNRDWGGAFAVYRGLTEALPYHRLFNAPISEAAIVGSAVGYAMCGGRVIVELMYADFIGCAGDEIFNQLPKWQAMSAGLLKMPVVLRVSVGSKYGAQHSQDWSALTAHIPGLKVVFPATPYDAKGLMTAALNGTDPVVFFESQRIYDVGEQFEKGGVPRESYEIKIGEPDIKRVGSDVTILSIGAVLYRALDAAKILDEKYGISAEIIDARSIVPFNYTPVIESVKKTGRIIIVGDACERGSVMRDMAAVISELAFDYLDAPVAALGSRNWIIPAYELEGHFFPQAQWIVDIVCEKLLPVPGYVAATSCTDTEKLDREAKGV